MIAWIRKMIGLCEHKWVFERRGAFSDHLPVMRDVFKCQKCGKLKVRS